VKWQRNTIGIVQGNCGSLSNEVCNVLETGGAALMAQLKTVAGRREMAEKHNWHSARKLWIFNERSGSNVVVDATQGAQYMNEIKDSLAAGLAWVSKEGVLAGETLRGVQFNLLDVVLHADAIHRGGGQLIPAARNVYYAAQLTANPRLLEPVFLVEIQCPQSEVGSIYSLFNRKRGAILEVLPRVGTPIVDLKTHLPVMESFGIVEELRSVTGGQAFAQCVFDHWSLVPGIIDDASSKTSEVITLIRKRKGIALQIPPLDNFLDKL